MRAVPALFLATGLVLTLGACGNPVSNLADCVPEYESGGASEQIEATGEFGSEPTVSFPTPLITHGRQVTTLAAGEGDPLFPGQVVDFQVTGFNASTGESFTASSYDPEDPIRRTIGSDVIGTLLQCATIGSRLAATITAGDIYGADGQPAPGLAPEDTVVLLIDVQRAFLGKANGTDQLPRAGFPAIALAPNGEPGITIPNEEPPTELGIEVLKQGHGDEIKEGDNVVTHFTAVVWDSKEEFGSSWDVNVPANFIASDSPGFGEGVPTGIARALIGERVGSQVVVVLPPEFGYEEGTAPQKYVPGSTLVFVMDILGIQ